MNNVDVKQVIVLRTRYPDEKGGTRSIRKGKLIAQACHASIAWLHKRLMMHYTMKNFPSSCFSEVRFTPIEYQWLTQDQTKVVVYVETEEELLRLHEQAKEANLRVSLIQDKGYTEFNEPTYTAIAIGPNESSQIDAITGHLPLL